ncbi:hypothetical protein ES319_D02G186100v1 [Gossypium barbadense]|uniref:Pyrrolidone-carboxylate peptidase n=1 Tax=Gossypium barbadense TaxID=3634 RepID=A0A5J5SJ50_GOSBA|nr:hypothetical protein ES319_D02G186100v1 [Gossypium barbadense]
MGSQEPKAVTINVTGFKKFQGIAHNPTETIVNNLKNFVESKGLLPAGVTLRSCTVLETAGSGALPLHLGVDGGARKFTLEQQAVNEASFFCPDELGWQPMRQPIVADDGGIPRKRQTTCSIEAILRFLKNKGYAAMTSNDAGLFICNYVYYQSLRFAEQKGHKSLFVHVPLFSTINEETQMQFVASLLEAIASTC